MSSPLKSLLVAEQSPVGNSMAETAGHAPHTLTHSHTHEVEPARAGTDAAAASVTERERVEVACAAVCEETNCRTMQERERGRRGWRYSPLAATKEPLRSKLLRLLLLLILLLEVSVELHTVVERASCPTFVPRKGPIR